MDGELKLVSDPAPHFQFTHSPLMNKVHVLQIDTNTFLQQAMQNDLSQDFHDDIEFRVRNERNFDIVVWGETGSGKSLFAQSIVNETVEQVRKYVNKSAKFNVDYVTFTRTEWLEQNEQMKRGEGLIFDEDDQSVIGTGSMRQLDEQEKVEKTLRQSQYNYVFCSPLVEQHVEHYIFKAFDIDFEKELTRAVLYKREDTGLILPYGVVILEKHEVEGYQEKKERFREAVQNRTVKDRFKEYDTVARTLIEKFHINDLKKRAQKNLVQRFFPRFVDDEVKEIVTSIELISEGVDLTYSEF